ncbi:MAG TPA: hypothetical protein VFT16_03890 [Candidatus Saccharimonadales bacterium]|nr:hypothetical protein [Candidatus Saccharimonadales bacterium]
MNLTIIASMAAVVVVAAIVVIIIRRRQPRPLKVEQFQNKWREMQKQLGKKETWKQAVIDADNILDEVLKKKRFGGKNMGERLTKAQRLLSDNEGVWFGHKLRKEFEANPESKAKEKDIKEALIGIRQALKDLGALPDGK